MNCQVLSSYHMKDINQSLEVERNHGKISQMVDINQVNLTITFKVYWLASHFSLIETDVIF